MLRKLAIPAVCLSILLLFLAFGSSSGKAQGGVYWNQIDLGLPSNYTLNSVYMVDGADGAWVVGDDGTKGYIWRVKRQNGTWSISSTTFFYSPLRSIVAISENNVWVVGDKGLILHKKDDRTWDVFPGIAPDVNLLKIQMFGAGETGWAVGYTVNSDPAARQAVLLHYQNGAWTRDSAISGDGELADIHFDGAEGFATDGPQVWHFTNGSWSREDIVAPCPPAGIGCGVHYEEGIRALGSGEAWMVGVALPGHIVPRDPFGFILHRADGQWSRVVTDAGFADDPFAAARYYFSPSAITFSGNNIGLIVGGQKLYNQAAVRPFALSYLADHQWRYNALPPVDGQSLLAVSQADDTHALAVGTGGLVMGYGYSDQPPAPWPTETPTVSPTATPLVYPTVDLAPYPPTTPVPDQQIPNVTYFPETGHSIQGGFKVYWEAHGGLQQFGYPITQEFDMPYEALGKTFKVQFFQRAQFEYHPENRPPYDILLSLLGRQVTANRTSEAPFQPKPNQNTAGGLYFPDTQHNMAPELVGYWQNTGGLPVYGYPISEPFQEKSPTDGKLYLVQYFERNRLEYHPELPEQYRVSLGLLGTQVLHDQGWLP